MLFRKHDASTPYIIGLTGGIASGKSNIAKYLKNLDDFEVGCFDSWLNNAQYSYLRSLTVIYWHMMPINLVANCARGLAKNLKVFF